MLRITSAAGFGLTAMFGVAFAYQTAGIGPIVAAVYVTLGTIGGGTVGWFFGSCISCQSPCPCCCHTEEADDLESQKIVHIYDPNSDLENIPERHMQDNSPTIVHLYEQYKDMPTETDPLLDNKPKPPSVQIQVSSSRAKSQYS